MPAAISTSLKDEDERDVAENQVAYAVNVEIRSEGRSPLAVTVDEDHPAVRAVLTALPLQYRPKGKQAIVDEIETLVDLEVFR